MWSLLEALEGALGDSVDLRFGHVLGALDLATALRLAEAAEAACGQDGFGHMHAWLMSHPECHEAGEASEWADAAGLDVMRFRADLWESAAAAVQAHQVAARAIGADHGPSLWLAGARYTGEPSLTALLRACHSAYRVTDVALREAALDQREEWLALASHELRSPLAVLHTLTGMMVAAKEAGVAPNDAHLLWHVLARHVKKDVCAIHASDRLFADLGLTRLKLVHLIIDIEDIYDIRLTTEALASLRTAGDIASAVRNAVAGDHPIENQGRTADQGRNGRNGRNGQGVPAVVRRRGFLTLVQ